MQDNTALVAALKSSEKVLCCFIVDPVQVSGVNEFASENCIQFMAESLMELSQELKQQAGRLYILHGHTQDIVKRIIHTIPIDALFINRDYTPFSLLRDENMQALCNKNKMEYHTFHDALLHAPEEIQKSSGGAYTIFTPYWKKARTFPVKLPEKNHHTNYYTHKLFEEYDLQKLVARPNQQLAEKPGRAEGLKILKNIAQFKDYLETRDTPALETTRLSAHHKFGTLSIREVFYALHDALGNSHPLLRQLYWRDFFTQIAFFFPRVFSGAFHEKYNALPWNKSEADFKRWCTGTTGFPIVDAGMRELNATGFMHNRVRMIAASFLIKDLHISWRTGEKYFAQHLVDYDPAVNNGNWQWVASTGCDAQPYFRIFNPWLQQKKFDDECIYIKRWIPELKNLPPKMIHRWYDTWSENKHSNYPQPMVDHTQESGITKRYYKKSAIKPLA